jgi:glycosyltransferase involved in cell wall biosynthesis
MGKIVTAVKKKIMIFCDYYLPGYKSGGGTWTIVHLVERFSDRYDFFIVTRNYDGKTDKRPYTTIKTDDWNKVGEAQVFYFSAKNFNQIAFAALVNEVNPDTFFLNSFFSTPVVKFLSARRKKLFPDVPLVLAPCGELSKASLAVRGLKKKLFLRYAKTVGLYKNIIWKATTEIEKREITTVMGNDIELMIASDLAPKSILPDYDPSDKPKKEKGAVSFAFVLRLVRVKNVEFFLKRLQQIKKGDITFDLIGPLEDEEYWQEIRPLLDEMPPNVTVNVTEALPHAEALRRVCSTHFFVSPTLSENFGYVFLEATAAGSPLLISDRTSWNDIEDNNAGWIVPLAEPGEWVEKIHYCLEMEDPEYREMSREARKYSVEWLANPDIERDTAAVLDRAFRNKAEVAGK